MSKAIRIRSETGDRDALVVFMEGKYFCVEAIEEDNVIPIWFGLDAAIEICEHLDKCIDEMKTIHGKETT